MCSLCMQDAAISLIIHQDDGSLAPANDNDLSAVIKTEAPAFGEEAIGRFMFDNFILTATDLFKDFIQAIYKKHKGNVEKGLKGLGPKHLNKLSKNFLTAEEVELSSSYVKKKTYVHKKKPGKKSGCNQNKKNKAKRKK